MKNALILSALLFASTRLVAAAPSDAETFQIVHTANAGEIAAAKLAQTSASSKDVKSFADGMIKDHSDLDKGGADLAAKLKITPQDSDTSKALKSDGDKELADLKALSGAAFDKAYVDAQVKDHQAVLDTIDSTLLPAAQNAEVKAMLTSARPKVQAHLDHAKTLQAKLKSAH